MSSSNGTSGHKGSKIAIVLYSMHGHTAALAESIKTGVESASGNATIYQVLETLSQEVLRKKHAPAKADYPIITPEVLATYGGFLFGVSTHYGNFPAQWNAFWDTTGKLWTAGAFAGKYAGVFVSAAGQGGGQEETVQNSLSTLVHHGIIFVPLGYKYAFPQLTSMVEIRGGSPWGAGGFTGGDDLRQLTAMEHEIARIQGKTFAEHLAKVTF